MFSFLFGVFFYEKLNRQKGKKGKRRLRNGRAINCPDDKWRWCYQNSALRRGNAGQQHESWGLFPFEFFILLPQRLHGELFLLKREVFVFGSFIANLTSHILQRDKKVTWENEETRDEGSWFFWTWSPFHGTAVGQESLFETHSVPLCFLPSGCAIEMSLHYFDNRFMWLQNNSTNNLTQWLKSVWPSQGTNSTCSGSLQILQKN